MAKPGLSIENLIDGGSPSDCVCVGSLLLSGSQAEKPSSLTSKAQTWYQAALQLYLLHNIDQVSGCDAFITLHSYTNLVSRHSAGGV